MKKKSKLHDIEIEPSCPSRRVGELGVRAKACAVAEELSEREGRQEPFSLRRSLKLHTMNGNGVIMRQRNAHSVRAHCSKDVSTRTELEATCEGESAHLVPKSMEHLI